MGPRAEWLFGEDVKRVALAMRELSSLTEIDPANVRLIGVPAYEPYAERVYRVSFNTPNVPVDERLVLEVFDSAGTRLSRFHLEIL